MAHIVCITHGMAGLLYSSFELLRRLDAAGHRITYASTADMEATVAAQGFAYVQLPPNKASVVLEKDRATSRWVRLCSIRRRRQLMVDAMGVSQFPTMLRELKPDLLLVDLEMHEHIISAVPLGIPIALLSPWMSIWKQPGLPPLSSEITPGFGWKGSRLGIELVWLRFRLCKLRRAWRQKLDTLSIDWVSVMRQHARETGFPFRKEVELHHWQIPFSYRSLPVICLRAREFEFPNRPRPSVSYVGPMICRRRKEPHLQVDVNAKLERLFAHFHEPGGNRRLIYCGFSSFFATDVDFAQRLIAAFKERPDWALVMGLGNRLKVDELGSLPPNCHAFPWVPQLRVLEHADAAIIHGGINTVDECIHFGVPMLAYSGGRIDMPGTVARVVYHGLGVKGNLRHDKPDDILRRVEQLMMDDHIQTNIRRMQQEVQKYARERRAEHLLTRLLRR